MTFINVTKLKVLLQMHSSLDEHLYEINYTNYCLSLLSVETYRVAHETWSNVSIFPVKKLNFLELYTQKSENSCRKLPQR
jgi:hypothetical protein